MKNNQIIVWIFFLCIISTQIQSAEHLYTQAINIESHLNVLKVLTDQQANIIPLNIDSNNHIDIPEALYLLMIQANMIEYEIHKSNDTFFCLKKGKMFASILEFSKNNYFVIHPDAIPTNYGFLWKMIPFITNNDAFGINVTVAQEYISISFFGTIFYEETSIGSFNLTMQVQMNQQNIVSGQMNLQIVTSDNLPGETHLYLFKIQSSYYHNVPLVDPPDTQGDTGNFSYIQIVGQGNNSYNLPWIPVNSPDLIKTGLLFMQIEGTKNLAVGHEMPMKSPNFELSFTSSETIYFMGKYDIKNQSSVNTLNVSISPYIVIGPKQVYRIHSSFTCKL